MRKKAKICKTEFLLTRNMSDFDHFKIFIIMQIIIIYLFNFFFFIICLSSSVNPIVIQIYI